jgi:hypothetical protein
LFDGKILEEGEKENQKQKQAERERFVQAAGCKK